MPTPVKYYSEQIRRAYGEVEDIAGRELLTAIPEELRSRYEEPLLESSWNEEDYRFVKAADKLSAWLKCIEDGKWAIPILRCRVYNSKRIGKSSFPKQIISANILFRHIQKRLTGREMQQRMENKCGKISIYSGKAERCAGVCQSPACGL